MIEVAVIIAVVGVVLVFAGRSVYRTVTGKNRNQCCGCDSYTTCGSRKR
jgi:Flp pilus assembly pilin Flp